MRVRFPLPAHYHPFSFICARRLVCVYGATLRFCGLHGLLLQVLRGLPSFGSNTLTSAGSAARNPQKFATPLYLNAASRTAFGVSGRRASAVRESRS